jgi:hypothetical protein
MAVERKIVWADDTLSCAGCGRACRCSKTYPITEDAYPRPRQPAMLGK